MKRLITLPCWFIFIILPSLAFAQSQERGEQLLQQAGQKVLPWPEMSFVASIDDRASTRRSVHKYNVFYKGDKVLIAYVAPAAENGNLLLMENDDLWFYSNDTRRPTRITPMQKMSGSVSFGDITNLSWKNYEVMSTEEVTIEQENVKKDAFLLHLSSNKKSTTYQKVEFWIEKYTKRPIMAVAYLHSGRKYKTIRYIKYEVVDGKDINTELNFIDHFNEEKVSAVRLTLIKQERGLPGRYFIKTSLAEVSNEVCR